MAVHAVDQTIRYDSAQHNYHFLTAVSVLLCQWLLHMKIHIWYNGVNSIATFVVFLQYTLDKAHTLAL
jgi:Ca2+/Na+ antiporter